ncbi:iron ABC transporter ATP-binding protein [Actinomyces oris]|uniref:Iron ABC transporter ATP-binding protein n=1 Tax=Actinomyces oris TaxID=544580 RepID=A0A1Q8VFU9_9ACTO|nr:ABC transporter ATP-binding protein [Actinomyces oris]OLO46924.1 iron ABC transporter ATP-binding protein [Actinomyces oris]OLO52282.1 iron ABC transporter ATP-binding protein [Actinomyces oris]
MTSVLHLDDVSLHRGSHQILRHVSWTVEEGQHWVLLGSNGAGKTTIARIASARLFPSSGTVDVLSERLGRVDVSELHPRIGLLSSALAADVQNGEKVLGVVLSASYGRIGRWREEYDDVDVERAHALLGALGAAHLADRSWGTLSSGERKRVELARALMPDPEMLILDEPASGLDLAGREQLLAALTEIISSPDSPSMVLVTHHLEEIPEGFTHALTLREGKVVGSGPLQEVLTADTISTTFGMELEVTHDRGRYAARGRPAGHGRRVAEARG